MACLLALLLLLTPFIAMTVQAQDDPSDPPEEEPSPSPIPSPTTDPIDPTGAFPDPTASPTAPPPTTTTTLPPRPDPIFSNSDKCTECKPHWPAINNCLAYLPPTSVNLTVITAVLPFYSCICKDDYQHIEPIAACASCLRTTGQLAYLHPMFYDVKLSDMRAYTQVCMETKNGTTVPPESAATATAGRHVGFAIVVGIVASALLL
ncbi:hypothetical protein BGW41_007349 [Actinomortierella wolfii]|nr:hypothetical protein BGW41_007349 [Actinomortierella wolfii]